MLSFKFDKKKLSSIAKEIKKVKKDADVHQDWNTEAIERASKIISRFKSYLSNDSFLSENLLVFQKNKNERYFSGNVIKLFEFVKEATSPQEYMNFMGDPDHSNVTAEKAVDDNINQSNIDDYLEIFSIVLKYVEATKPYYTHINRFVKFFEVLKFLKDTITNPSELENFAMCIDEFKDTCNLGGKVRYLKFICLDPGYLFTSLSGAEKRAIIVTSHNFGSMDVIEHELSTKFPVKFVSDHVIENQQTL